MSTRRCLRLFQCLLALGASLLFGFSFFSAQSFVAHAAATGPQGLSALTSLDRLPYLKTDTIAAGQSSFDRTGGNDDWGNFLYADSHGDNVLLDLTGPGTVYRMWFTGFDQANTIIKVYFDGASIPKIDMPLIHLFDGSTSPFLSPLVATDATSSGGFVSYVPLSFHSAIKITTNTGGYYYNLGYHVYSSDTNVTTWAGAEDSTSARNEWMNAGNDPISTAGNMVTSGTFNLAAGAAQPLFTINGHREIQSIKLHIPDVAQTRTAPAVKVTDDGRAFTGSSSFTMALNPSNTGVNLTRRLDYGIGNQKATVSVNGQVVGTWFDSGSDQANRWRDSTFSIPQSFTAGKSSMTITVTFVSSDIDWNEFTYWAYSIVGGNQKVLTDTLNVGNTASETAHSYTIVNQTWTGTRTFTYSTTDSATVDTLNNTWLRITWDNQTTPSVSSPIGSLFGLGQFGVGSTQALMMGLDQSDWLYLYFPMPFANHAHIDLVSQRSSTTSNISYEIQYKPFTGSLHNVGYFSTQFNSQTPTTTGTDALILNAQGAGQFLGVVQSMSGPLNRYFLEGDERVFVDGSGSPSIQGTGTEDFFNGGWYFLNGPYSNQMSGNGIVNLRKIGEIMERKYGKSGEASLFSGVVFSKITRKVESQW